MTKMAIGKSKTFKKLATWITTLSLAAGITFASKNLLPYSPGTAQNPSIHPLLAEKVNHFYSPPPGIIFLAQEVQKGTIDEDSYNSLYIRAFNHFQHWQTSEGLACGPIDCSRLEFLGINGFLSSIDWAYSPEVQALYPSGDHTWDRVKDDYQNHQISQHFGHIFHLISDLTVPAHVRNDVHPLSDDYEYWTNQHKREIMDLISPQSPPSFKNLEELMAALAQFTGSHFYSDNSRDGTIVGLTSLFEDNKIYWVKNVQGTNRKVLRTTLLVNFQDEGCLRDEWSVLGNKAVEYGLAALQLLQREASTLPSSCDEYAVDYFDAGGECCTTSSTGRIACLEDVIPAPTGSTPRGLAWDGTNLWLVSRDNYKIYQLSPSGSEVSSFSVSGYPYGLAWDGQYLWLTPDCFGCSQSTITKLTRSGEDSGSCIVSNNPFGLASDGTNIWYVENGYAVSSPRIHKVSTACTSSSSSLIELSSGLDNLSWSGSALWKTSGDGKIQRLSASSEEAYVLESLSAPISDPRGIAFDGPILWVAGPHKIYKLRLDN